MSYRLTARAKYDLVEIWRYIAEGSGNPEVAERFVRTLYKDFQFLSGNVLGGRARADLREGLRSFPAGEYVIFYRLAGKSILILRVLQGSRNMKALF
jgi:toxin ParE1/3/4